MTRILTFVFALLLLSPCAQSEEVQVAVGTSQMTYAIGKLVLWSNKPGLVDDQGTVVLDRAKRRAAPADLVKYLNSHLAGSFLNHLMET